MRELGSVGKDYVEWAWNWNWKKKDTFDGHTDCGEISQAKCGEGVGWVSWLGTTGGWWFLSRSGER